MCTLVNTLPVIRSKKPATLNSKRRKKIKSKLKMSTVILPDIDKTQKSAAWLIGSPEETDITSSKSYHANENHKTFRHLPVINGGTKKRSSSLISDKSVVENRRNRSRSSTFTSETTKELTCNNFNKHEDRLVLHDRIKEFMNKEIPGKPPSTRRYTVPKPQPKTNQENKLLKLSIFESWAVKFIETRSLPNLKPFVSKKLFKFASIRSHFKG